MEFLTLFLMIEYFYIIKGWVPKKGWTCIKGHGLSANVAKRSNSQTTFDLWPISQVLPQLKFRNLISFLSKNGDGFYTSLNLSDNFKLISMSCRGKPSVSEFFYPLIKKLWRFLWNFAPLFTPFLAFFKVKLKLEVTT